jgi:imidazolonepropionase
MASHGTTTAEVKSFSLGDESGEMRLLRAIQSLDGSPIELIPTVFASVFSALGFKGSAGAHAEWCAKVLLPLAARRKLAVFADILCEPGGYSLREARIFMQAARRSGFAIRAHAGLTEGCGVVRLAVESGAISVDHLDWLGPDGVQALAGSRTIATVIPGRAFQSNSSVRAPARALMDSGAAVALATGFDGLESPSCSMPMALSLACTASGFTAAEAIAAATINGAHALLCAERTGSLEVGKQADLVIAAVRDYRDLPYYFGVQTISRVFRRGVEITPERN